MSAILPAYLTLTDVKQLSAPLPDVELHGLDMGWYIVRLHRHDSIGLLVDANGEAQRFSGTQWVSRALAPRADILATVKWLST